MPRPVVPKSSACMGSLPGSQTPGSQLPTRSTREGTPQTSGVKVQGSGWKITGIGCSYVMSIRSGDKGSSKRRGPAEMHALPETQPQPLHPPDHQRYRKRVRHLPAAGACSQDTGQGRSVWSRAIARLFLLRACCLRLGLQLQSILERTPKRTLIIEARNNRRFLGLPTDARKGIPDMLASKLTKSHSREMSEQKERKKERKCKSQGMKHPTP